MNLSAKTDHLLKNAEGLRLFVYCDKCDKQVTSIHDTCSGGYATIGYGHKLKPSEYDLYIYVKKTITLQEAIDIFAQDISVFVRAVNELVTRKLNQNQFDALVMFAFNCGIGSFRGSSLLHKLNINAPLDQIQAEWMKWVHDDFGNVEHGLVSRRKQEFDLFKQVG